MATPKKAEAPKMMEASIGDLGATVAKLRVDLTALVTGDMSKLDDSVADLGVLWEDVGEFIQGLGRPLPVGSPDALKMKAGELKCECDQILQMIAAEKPRFCEAGAGGSLTEGAKIDKLLTFIQHALPTIIQLLTLFGG